MAGSLSAVLILVVTVSIALYDVHTGYVPNLVTLPLLALGVWLHFPGTVGIWVVCLLIFVTWRLGGMGGGDVKLWWALLWLTPPTWMHVAPYIFGGVLLVTAGVQVVLFRMRGKQIRTARPAAWRTVPYATWLLLAHVFSSSQLG